MQSCVTQIKYYNDNLRREDAIKVAVCMLNEVGETIDLSLLSQSVIAAEIQKTRSMIANMIANENNEILIEMKSMDVDSPHLSVMMIFNEILSTSFVHNTQLFCYIAGKLFRIMSRDDLLV